MESSRAWRGGPGSLMSVPGLVPRGVRLMKGLRFLKQADVLDRDHGLVGKGLEKSYLLIRERLDYQPANNNYADGNSFTQQRYSKE